MMTNAPTFTTPELWSALAAMSPASLDRLDFGVIGFGVDGLITHYNRFEADATGLTPSRLMGRHLWEQVAQCMNNYMVAQRFEDAARSAEPLDAVIDYLLTWRMKPTPVVLRLLARPPSGLQFLALKRLT